MMRSQKGTHWTVFLKARNLIAKWDKRRRETRMLTLHTNSTVRTAREPFRGLAPLPDICLHIQVSLIIKPITLPKYAILYIKV